MSLIRLLAVGRSLMGLKSEPVRYKLAQDNFFPKFESAKEGGLAGGIVERSSAERNEWSSATGPREECVRSERTTARGAGRAEAGRNRSFFGSRFTSRNMAKGSRTWVQGEFALESVKVVRNDLSDADVELVPARPETRRTKIEAPQPVPAQAGRSRGWSELTARLFEAGGLRT